MKYNMSIKIININNNKMCLLLYFNEKTKNDSTVFFNCVHRVSTPQ